MQIRITWEDGTVTEFSAEKSTGERMVKELKRKRPGVVIITANEHAV